MFVPDVYSQRAVMASVPWPSAPALHLPLLNRGRGGISNQLQIAAPSHYRPAVGQNDGIILKRGSTRGTQKALLKMRAEPPVGTSGP
jgi:hypothetical protein